MSVFGCQNLVNKNNSYNIFLNNQLVKQPQAIASHFKHINYLGNITQVIQCILIIIRVVTEGNHGETAR